MHKSQFSQDIASKSSKAPISPPSNLSSSAPTESLFQLLRPSHQRPRHSPSSSITNAGYLPRTSSLLPPPNIVPSSSSRVDQHLAQGGPSPSAGQENRPQTPPRSTNLATTTSPSKESLWNLNRWSASTGSSRASILTSRLPGSRFSRRASVDAANVFDASPPPVRQSPRKLQKTRRTSSTSLYRGDNSSTVGSLWENTHPALGLPLVISSPPLEQSVSGQLSQNQPAGTGPSSIEHHRPSVNGQSSQSQMYSHMEDSRSAASLMRPNTANTHRPAMPYEQDAEAYQPRGHVRSRSGKDSHELNGRASSKPPSQKAMLSRALQKANTAVQLDNAQNFVGAREAYAEACNLLHQVLLRTSGDEDQRKLEAIVSTRLQSYGTLLTEIPVANLHQSYRRARSNGTLARGGYESATGPP